jgi:hypothetical protein
MVRRHLNRRAFSEPQFAASQARLHEPDAPQEGLHVIVWAVAIEAGTIRPHALLGRDLLRKREGGKKTGCERQ